jgi:hypothetical protein
MSSRQEEKEARRLERMEQEERDRKAAARIKRVQYVVGGLLVVGIVAAVIVVVTSGGGNGGGGTDEPGTATTASGETVSLPEPALFDEQQAADAAGCKIQSPPNEGSGHAEKEFTADDYDANPPTSGTHFPTWAEDGIYEPGSTPPLGELVHTLEHGRVNVQYKPGTDETVIAQLEAFVGETDRYHMLLYENATDMKPAIAATAWDFALTCDEVNDKTWDALRTFRDAHLDRGPEKVP